MFNEWSPNSKDKGHPDRCAVKKLFGLATEDTEEYLFIGSHGCLQRAAAHTVGLLSESSLGGRWRGRRWW